MMEDKKGLEIGKKNLKEEVYKSGVRFHTIAMIMDKYSGNQKSKGILWIVPLFLAGSNISLKNVKLVTSAVNTCKSQTAITAETQEVYNRKYTLELIEAFDNLLNKLTKLKTAVESGENDKYKIEDIEKVCQFLDDIKGKIGDDADKIASSIYKSDRAGTDLPATIDRVSSGKVKTWALAFAGYKDNDRYDLITDDKKRNPVDIFFGDSINTRNSSGLKTLIGTNQLENINKQFISKLKNKDFSKELRDSGIKSNFGYSYFLSYFVQALLQIVLIDNEKMLTFMDRAIIKSNWDKFLQELSDPDLKNMFDEYKPDEIEDSRCPYKFVDFMLNKLLGKELIKKLRINEKRCKGYAEGSISISESLSEADHANQVITMGFDHNLNNLTYNNSLFLGQGNFVYASACNACQDMNNDLKRKLQLLEFELKTKKIKLDQSEYTISDEYKFGRIQEVKYKYEKDPKTGKKTRTDKIEKIEYKVPNDYDTDISAEDLMELVLKVQSIEKDLEDEFNKAISNFDKDKDENEDKNGKAKLFLDALIKFQKVGILLENNQIQSVLENRNIVEAIFNVVSSDNCDAKYTSVYSWFINGHKNVVEQIDLEFLKLDLLTADGARGLFNREEYTNFQINADDTVKLLLTLWKINAFDETLIEGINSNPDIIQKMFAKDKECTNQIIIKFLGRFNDAIIRNINLADDNLSDNQINEIFYTKHKILLKEQIQSIDCSKLNILSIKILFKDHLADISQHNVETFSNIALEELTPSTLANLLKQDNNLNFTKHKNWLKNLYLDDLYYQLNKTPKIFISFVAKHMENFSDDQILSLRKYVFQKFENDNSNLEADAKKVLNRLKEIEKKGDLEKNIVKIMSIKRIGQYGRQILATLVHIYQKSPDDLKALLSYLIEHNEAFRTNVDETFDWILSLTVDKFKEKIFSNYEAMYEKLSEDDKKKYKKLDNNGLGNCFLNMQKMLKDILKEDKDSNDISKGKNINYLCLSKLPMTTDSIIKLQDLSGLLSEKQIQSINISNKNFELGSLYSLLDRFGNKLKYEQFHNLISNFNSTETKLLSGYGNYPNKNDNISSGILAKIALISNFINEKEKEFQDKYSDIDDKFGDTKLELDCVINAFAVQKYPGINEKQLEYFKNNTHNRELYEKSDDAENVNNDLKIGKDDDQILHKLQDLNNELNDKINELKAKVELNNKINENELKEKIESNKIGIDDIKKELEKIDIDDVTDNVLNNVVHNVIGNAKKELEGIKLQNESREKTELNNKINELKGKIESNKIGIDDIKKELEEIKLQNDFEQELEKIKSRMKEFDQLYYGRKNEFSKLKTNFLAALGNLDTGKVSICFRNIYSNYEKNFWDSEKLKNSLEKINDVNKELWKLNTIVIKAGDQEKKYTFNEFFMDGFIKIQSEKHKDGTESNFSPQQKQSMGIINVVETIEEKDEKDATKTKVIKVEQCTPEYILNNLPLILGQFHCDHYELGNEMRKVGLFDLTLKFDENNKKSLERFIDSEKFKFIENEAVENEADRRRNEEINAENHLFFKPVKKLFCDQANHIVENADLVFETEGQNKLQIKSARSIQAEFHLKLERLIQKVRYEEKVINEEKLKVAVIEICLDKQNIIDNFKKMDARAREHILFFCGDWICCSNQFCSKNNFLTEYKNIVKKRIDFACRNQNNPNDKLRLTDETYNLLTGITLISGLQTANRLDDMDGTIIDEICFLITGKNKDFSQEDAQLIMELAKITGSSHKYFSRLIVKHVIKNQCFENSFKFVKAFAKCFEINNGDKIEFIDHIANSNKEIDFMEVMSAIDKFGFYPYYGNDHNYAAFGSREKKLSFKFMQKLMDQLLQKYQYGVFPTADQKTILGRFLENFIVGNDEFDKNKQEVSRFFTELMKKVPPEKSKDVTKEIIRICSNLREKSQRATILKCVLDASNDSLKGLELLEVLEQYNYARGFIRYDNDGYEQGIDPIEFGSNSIEKLISDIIQKPLPLTKKEVQRLEWFCTNCYRNDRREKNSEWDGGGYKDSNDNEDIQRKEAKLFYSLMEKMPEGSMSIDMFRNLVAHFFPSLASNIEYKYNSNAIKKITFNLDLFDSQDSRYLYKYKDSCKRDIINRSDFAFIWAYVLPQGELKDIIYLKEADKDYLEYRNDHYDVYYDQKKYIVANHPEYKSGITDEYQKNIKQLNNRKEEEAEAEQEEAKREREKKMIEVTNKLDVDKIKKRMRWSQFKQICKSAKEQEEAKNNSVNNINKEIEIKENGIEPDPKNQTRINGTQSPVTTDNNIIINNINNNIIINNINNNIIINNINNNVIIDNNQSNPYTLLAVLGIFLPIIPAIIFGIKIYNKKHKLTVGDVVLIIVGLIPVISAIVFGINAYKYNQNNLAKKTQKDLKYAGNINENDNDIEEKEDENNKGKKINLFDLIADSKQNQNQNQENENNL